VPYIPEHALAAGVGVLWQRLGLDLNVTWQTWSFTTASNTDSLTTPDGIPDSRFGTVPSYYIVDVTAWGYVDPDEHIKLMFGVHNVTDTRVRVTRHPIGPRANKPRWIYGGVELSF
jgi:outer membrane receptor protein involved in Fe transport